MIKKLLVLSTLLLSGCFYQVAHHGDIEKAQVFCADKGGINNVTIFFDGMEYVECQNGSQANLSRNNG